jgi:hypothetical protein
VTRMAFAASSRGGAPGPGQDHHFKIGLYKLILIY